MRHGHGRRLIRGGLALGALLGLFLAPLGPAPAARAAPLANCPAGQMPDANGNCIPIPTTNTTTTTTTPPAPPPPSCCTDAQLQQGVIVALEYRSILIDVVNGFPVPPIVLGVLQQDLAALPAPIRRLVLRQVVIDAYILAPLSTGTALSILYGPITSGILAAAISEGVPLNTIIK
jgi:hypothetical protein